MTITINQNPEEQCFDIRVDGRRRTSAHHATTADLLEWFRKLVVEHDYPLTVTVGCNPLDTPEPRYLILTGNEDLPHNLGAEA